MNSTELIGKAKEDFQNLSHKNYDKKSFLSGYYIGFFKSKKKQTKKQSIIETTKGIVIELVIIFLIQICLYPLLNIPVTINQNIIITIVYFVFSFIRGYAVRRFFNKFQ